MTATGEWLFAPTTPWNRIMPITVNGKLKSDIPASVAALLAELGLDPARVAVEHNRAILPAASFDTTTLKDGDELEIVQFVGGG